MKTPATLSAKQVRLTEAAKLSAFWKSDPWRNGVGVICGIADDSFKVWMTDGRGMKKLYYIAPADLQEI